MRTNKPYLGVSDGLTCMHCVTAIVVLPSISGPSFVDGPVDEATVVLLDCDLL